MRVTKTPPIGIFSLVVDAWTEPFWRACREHHLVIPQCGDCGTARFPPGPFCPACHSQEVEWFELPGGGSVYSYTIIDRSITPEMNDSLPYAPIVVSLDGANGVRLISSLVGAPLARIHVGARVQVTWHDHSDGVTVPCFALA